MWTRELLKSNAKQALQGRYWRSFWVCFVLSIAGLGGASAGSGSAARQTVDTASGDTASIYDMFSGIPDNMLAALAVGAFIGAIISICWVLFVLYPLKAHRRIHFMRAVIPGPRPPPLSAPSASPTATPSSCSCSPT